MSLDEGEDKPPLSGRTIVVTRSREQASALSERLRALGAAVVEIPTISIVPPASYDPLDGALEEFSSFDWLIVTSANAARVIGERFAVLKLPAPAQPRIVAVGPATAAALRLAGLRVDVLPEQAVAESILRSLSDGLVGKRVLLARAAVARDALPVGLAEAGAEVTVVDAYRTVLAADSLNLVAETFLPGAQVDALTFTSSSTVTNLAALLAAAGLTRPVGLKIFSIGPITSRTLREQGIEPDGEAARHDVEGLVEVVVRGLCARR